MKLWRHLIIGSKVHADDLQLRCQSLHSGFQPVGNRFAFHGRLLTHMYLWTEDQKPDPPWNSTDPYLNDRFSKWQELVVCSYKALRAVFVHHRKSCRAIFSLFFSCCFPAPLWHLQKSQHDLRVYVSLGFTPGSLETPPSIAQRFSPISCQNSKQCWTSDYPHI